jgi:hypothetical protein
MEQSSQVSLISVLLACFLISLGALSGATVTKQVALPLTSEDGRQIGSLTLKEGETVTVNQTNSAGTKILVARGDIIGWVDRDSVSCPETHITAAPSVIAEHSSPQSGVQESADSGTQDLISKADGGDAVAQVSLGLKYKHGRGFPQDNQKACEYFKKAADQNSQSGYRNLGSMYMAGQGVPHDPSMAAFYYQKAVDAGDHYAAKLLAGMYEKGLGVKKSTEEANRLNSISRTEISNPTPIPTPAPLVVAVPAPTPTATPQQQMGPWVLADPATQRVNTANSSTGTMGATNPSNSQTTGNQTTGEKLNQLLGVAIFSSKPLLEESPLEVASRLRIPEESKTSYEHSFRTYIQGGNKTIGGCRIFSAFVTGTPDKFSEASFLLANKGDTQSYLGKNVSALGAVQNYEAEIRKDNQILSNLLNEAYGSSKSAVLGAGPGAERGSRWDIPNTGISIFLVDINRDYAAIRFLPTAQFDDPFLGRRNFVATKENISKRILRGENGDVCLELPMIDQGAKGYCVVATYARVLRYYGLRGDMDQLAHAANTDYQKGTRGTDAMNATYNDLLNAGARISPNVSINIGDIKPHIDRGQPVIWGMIVTPELMKRVNARREARKQMKDPDAWSTKLAGDRANTFKLAQTSGDSPTGGYHCALIIGYNQKTREVAMSNSFGEKYAVDWIPIEEAIHASQPIPGFTIEY